MIKARLIADFSEQENKRIAAGVGLVQWYGPGAMWFCPWYHDPLSGEGMEGFLNEHYIRDWSTRRAPLMVLCPDGSSWCPDQKSSNGTGWTVTGDAPLITCAPSIVVRGYHGYLTNGVFTADLDGARAPMSWTPPDAKA